MNQHDEYVRSIRLGELALQQIRSNEVPAWPRNYELWFSYAAGFLPGLNKAINTILKARGRITLEELDKIYSEHITGAKLEERVEEVGHKVTGEITDVMKLIEKAVGSTSTYSESLKGASDNLNATEDRVAVRRIVDQLIYATRDVETNNRELSKQLAESRRQIQDLQDILETVRHEALTDQLTALANRKQFDRSITAAITTAEASDEPFSLLMADIDHFKIFNDNFGHQTGDQVLRLVAHALKQNIKGQDIACRYGGEEFAVIFPRTPMEQAHVVAEHIRKAVMAKELVKRSTGENLGRITISGGVTQWKPGDTVQTVIERADQMLYAAKRNGRNQMLMAEETNAEVEVPQVA